MTDPYVSAYVYADNRPTVLIDPSGLCAWNDPFDCVSDAAGAIGDVGEAALAKVGEVMYNAGGKFVIEKTCTGIGAGLADWFSLTNWGSGRAWGKGQVGFARLVSKVMLKMGKPGSKVVVVGSKVISKVGLPAAAAGTAADWWCRPFEPYLGQITGK